MSSMPPNLAAFPHDYDVTTVGTTNSLQQPSGRAQPGVAPPLGKGGTQSGLRPSLSTIEAQLLRRIPGSRVALIFAALLTLSGCGKPADVNSKPAPSPAPAVSRPEPAPEDAVRQLAAGLQENRPEVLWDSLPRSYQSDVNDLVRSAAAKMDPEIWSRSIAAARRSAALLRSKRDFLLEHPALNNLRALPPDQLAANWDGLVGLIDLILESDAARLDKLEEFDGGQFLKTTGGQLMGQISDLSEKAGNESLPSKLKKQFSDLKVTLVRRDDTTAVVRVDTGDPNSPPQDRTYVLMEGKWIPRHLAGGWTDRLEGWHRWVDGVTDSQSMSSSRKATLVTLARIEKALDRLESADDPDQFLAIFNEQIMLPIVLAASGQSLEDLDSASSPDVASNQDPPAAARKAAGEDPRVTVVVHAALDEAARDAWQEKLAAATDKPAIGLALPSGEGSATKFEVSPVADVQAFAKRLSGGKVTAVDEKTRSVTIESSPAATPRRPE